MSTRARHLELGREANEYTQSWLVRGGSNRWHDFGSRGENNRMIAETRVEVAVLSGPSIESPSHMSDLGSSDLGPLPVCLGGDWLHYLRTSAIKAKLAATGNCGEHAAVAFVHLVDAQHVSAQADLILEYQWSDEDPNHAWVVLGRAEADDPSEPWNWVEEAVVVDPWHGSRGRVYPAADWRRRMYRGSRTRPQNIWRLAPVSHGRYRGTTPLFGGQ